jgi:sarcosine oxidase delta subunit
MDVTDQPLGYIPPRFTYAGAPEGPDYEAWREEFCRRFCQLDADTATAEHIECTVEISQVRRQSRDMASPARSGA